MDVSNAMPSPALVTRRGSLRLITAVVVIAIGALSTRFAQAEAAPGEGCFVFSYFKGNGADGLHLAWSRDALHWEPLNDDQPLTSPSVGGKLMRDPSIVRGPDGVFHMVWSTGWWDLGFGYASSKDLMHWSEQRFVPVNKEVAVRRHLGARPLL